MPGEQRGLTQFWQELKRRKVVRVITIYAAASFVILQLVEILAPSLRLPEWTMNFILVLLIVGFIIAVILSWIYDIHPEGGIVKTESERKVAEETAPPSSNSWKIASYISFVVIIAMLILNIIPRANSQKSLDKSIAVLPFQNYSNSAENEHVINQYMASVHDNLCRIKDLRVLSLFSTEQFRNNPRPIPEVARELNVGYILSASGQEYDNIIQLSVKLWDENEKLIWSHQYDEQINEVNDHVSIQSEIAQLVASKIEAVITPEEKQLIEKVPTTSLTALDFYQRGKDELEKYLIDRDDREALGRTEDLYYKALEYDSTFALAYTGLAMVYWYKHFREELLNENFLDSVLILADKALSFDDQLAEAYTLRGDYYRLNNNNKEAINEYDKAIKLNPNDWMAYYSKGIMYAFDDLVNAIYNYQKAASLQKGFLLPDLLRRIGRVFARAGFKESAYDYIEEALELDDDSAAYYAVIAEIEESHGNFEKAIKLGEKSLAIDSTNSRLTYRVGLSHSYLGQNERYLEYIKKYHKIIANPDNVTWSTIWAGYAFWINGYTEEAEYYFNKALEFYNALVELNRHLNQDLHTYYSLAALHAFRGDRDKAYENLRLMNQRTRMPQWVIKDIKNDPLFNSIRDEPEFQQIVRDVEAKYQAEHERVRKWLEENDML
jgi:TolB-like protein/Tfp pilus assembly protein PilF